MSPHLPAVSARKVIKALEKAGFVVHHTTGSHAILRSMADPTRRVTVPIHNRDLKHGTMRVIIKQSGLSTVEFLELL